MAWHGVYRRVGENDESGRFAEYRRVAGKLDGGEISLPGTLDARAANPRAVFQPRLEDVEIGTILNAFDYPIALTGKMSLAGDFSGADIDARRFVIAGKGRRMLKCVIRVWKG